MTLHIDLPPKTEAWITAEATRRGIQPVDLVRAVLNERAAAPSTGLGDDQDATIALLQSWIDDDATDDPEELREAEVELLEFKRDMNAPRKEAGERLLFPEVE
jgi:hypothetical protein